MYQQERGRQEGLEELAERATESDASVAHLAARHTDEQDVGRDVVRHVVRRERHDAIHHHGRHVARIERTGRPGDARQLRHGPSVAQRRDQHDFTPAAPRHRSLVRRRRQRARASRRGAPGAVVKRQRPLRAHPQREGVRNARKFAPSSGKYFFPFNDFKAMVNG